MPEKVSVTLPGTVEKIIKSPHPSVPEKAEIALDGADELYREIRIENSLTDKRGEEVRLEPGAREAPRTTSAPPDEQFRTRSVRLASWQECSVLENWIYKQCE